MKLTNKIAVVTGASSGIGAGIARAFGAQGATVIVNYASSKAGADAVVASIEAAGGKAVALQADMSKAAEVAGLFERVKPITARSTSSSTMPAWPSSRWWPR
jgi:3-oxoacyl-[acyl-carrier protein] reductase